MAATTFLVPRIPDKSVLALKEAVEERYGANGASVQYAGMALNDPEIAALKARKGPTYILTECHVPTKEGRFTLIVRRCLDAPDKLLLDSVEIQHSHSPHPSAKELLEFGDLVRSKIKFPNPEMPDGTDNASLVLLQKEIAALGSLHHEMIAETASARSELEADYGRLQAKLQEEKTEAAKVLSEKEAQSLARIEAEKAELQAKIDEFDVSDHMRARRKLRDDITTEVRLFLRAPTASTWTRAKFVGLVAVILTASAVAGVFSYESFVAFISAAGELDPGDNVGKTTEPSNLRFMLLFLAVRGALLAATCLGLAVYAISMVRKVHDEEVRYQRELQRYGMDINRASWIIETAMEMTTKDGADLPEKWVEGACRGLFQSPTAAESDYSPISALGAIMGMAPDITVEGDGKKFDFKSKQIAKAAKDGL